MARKGLRLLPSVALLLTLGLAVVACGPARGSQAGGGGFVGEQAEQRVEVVADPKGLLRWTRQQYEAAAGDVTFVVQNPSPSRHNFVVEGNGIRVQSPAFGTGTHTYTLKGLAPAVHR
jgi:hypothetical protein